MADNSKRVVVASLFLLLCVLIHQWFLFADHPSRLNVQSARVFSLEDLRRLICLVGLCPKPHKGLAPLDSREGRTDHSFSSQRLCRSQQPRTRELLATGHSSRSHLALSTIIPNDARLCAPKTLRHQRKAHVAPTLLFSQAPHTHSSALSARGGGGLHAAPCFCVAVCLDVAACLYAAGLVRRGSLYRLETRRSRSSQAPRSGPSSSCASLGGVVFALQSASP